MTLPFAERGITMKKALCLFFCLLMAVSGCLPAFAADPNELPQLKEKFLDGSGPEIDGLTIDYVYYAPETAGQKLPLVVYFHGAGQGRSPRAQIEENNFPLWASDEIQSRFTGGGAFLLVPRTHEEKGELWGDSYVAAMKATIDDFIAQHADSIDLTRLYVGGFSMGGKMTLKMASSYPQFFAAAFPMCPAYQPSTEQLKALADLPVWLFVSRFDIIAGYYTYSKKLWSEFCGVTNVPADCRLTLFGRVKDPAGRNTSSNHFVWLAVSNDLFTYEGGTYPNAVTTDANGDPVELVSPDGVVSWLCRYTSDYDGQPLTPTGTLAGNPDRLVSIVGKMLKAMLPLAFDAVKTFFTDLWARITAQ